MIRVSSENNNASVYNVLLIWLKFANLIIIQLPVKSFVFVLVKKPRLTSTIIFNIGQTWQHLQQV